MHYRAFLLTGAFLGLLVPVAVSAPAPEYHVVKTIPLTGDGGWDYLSIDGAAHRLYISRGTHVMVVDIDKGEQVGDIPDTQGVHGIAIDHALNRGFTSNGGANSVTPFDLKTLKADAPVSVGQGPDCILFDPGSNRVFTFNGRSQDSTAIDADSEKVAGTIALGGRPEFAAADGRGHVYVNIEDKSEIVQIDSKALTVLNRWPIAPGDSPSGLSIDSRHHRLFSTCHNNMMVVMDADTGKVIATPAIGRGTDASAFDPKTGLAFSSNGDGTLTVVQEKDPNTFEVAQNVTTEPGARTMALDPKTHSIYLCTAKIDTTPPPAGQEQGQGPQRFRRRFVPGSFHLIVVGE
ncbi:MAG TPA: YncE family protein [Chthonomonadaceae bacterium]|nr:YncE family protein [Chthonomonadaceae bacterium]